MRGPETDEKVPVYPGLNPDREEYSRMRNFLTVDADDIQFSKPNKEANIVIAKPSPSWQAKPASEKKLSWQDESASGFDKAVSPRQLAAKSTANEMDQEAPSTQAEASSASVPPRLNSLDGSRFVAAAAIVFYHFYEKDVGPLAHWGSCWVQYFFALSGFVLAYSELTKPREIAKRQTQMQYLHRRLSSTYPVYIFSLLTVLFEAGHEDHTDYEWGCLPYHFSMMQCWFASCSHWNLQVHNYQCCSQTWNSVDWYMSVLVPLWLLARPLSERFRDKSLLFCSVSIALLWLWSFVPYWIALWNAEHNHGMVWIRTFDAVAFHPLGYLHVFACGIPAARLFILLGMEDAETGSAPTGVTSQFRLKETDMPVLFNWGACIGYLGLLFVFAYVDYDQRWILYHSGGLLPFMVLILCSLSFAKDPIAYAFAMEPFPTLGRISYAMYLIQFRVWWLAYHLQGGPPKKSYPFLLVGASYLVHNCIEVPYTEWKSLSRERKDRGWDDQVVDILDFVIDLAWRHLQGLYGCCACLFQSGPGTEEINLTEDDYNIVPKEDESTRLTVLASSSARSTMQSTHIDERTRTVGTLEGDDFTLGPRVRAP